MPHPSSLPLAIAGLIVVGASWCLTGAVIGRAPKEGFSASLITFTGSIVSVMTGLAIAFGTNVQNPVPRGVLVGTLLVYLVGGAISYFGVLAMSAGMQRGPNGAVWGIAQSALIVPFICGILVFGSQATLARLAGIACVLAGLTFYTRTKSDPSAAGAPKGQLNFSWKMFAFMAFGCFALQQTLMTTPSYFEQCRLVSSVLRTVAAACGAFVSYSIILLLKRKQEPIVTTIAAQWRRGRFWAYVFSLQFFGILFAYTLLYPGMDELARHGAGALAYPLMVASCIVAFNLYARLGLRERAGRNQILAILFCLAGLALMAIPA